VTTPQFVLVYRRCTKVLLDIISDSEDMLLDEADLESLRTAIEAMRLVQELYQACLIAEDVLAYLEDEIGEGHLEVRDALHAVAAAIDKARGES